jgi:hypothetical protein
MEVLVKNKVFKNLKKNLKNLSNDKHSSLIKSYKIYYYFNFIFNFFKI